MDGKKKDTKPTQDNKSKQEKAGQSGSQPQQPQSNAPAIVAVIILLVAAVFLVYFLMQDVEEDLGDDNDTDTEEFDEADLEAPAIIEIIAEDPEFSTLHEAIMAADEAEGVDLQGILGGNEELTVFAPTNDAFEALGEGELDSLLDNPEELAEVLQNHVAEGVLSANELTDLDGETVATLQGGEVMVGLDEDDAIFLDGEVMVTTQDIEAGNGVVHAVNGVLTP